MCIRDSIYRYQVRHSFLPIRQSIQIQDFIRLFLALVIVTGDHIAGHPIQPRQDVLLRIQIGKLFQQKLEHLLRAVLGILQPETHPRITEG